MIVAVLLVRVVKTVLDQVVEVVAVGHRLVTAALSVHVVGVVAARLIGAGVGVVVAHGDHVLVDMALTGMVKVPVVEVVDVSLVLDGDVAAVSAVGVLVPFMGGVGVMAHESQGTGGSPASPSRCA